MSFSNTLLQVHSNTHMTWNIEANKCQIKCYGTNFTLDNYGTNIVRVTVQIVRYHAIRSQHSPIYETTCQDNSFLFAFTPCNLTKTLKCLFEILAYHQNIFKHKYLKNLTRAAPANKSVKSHQNAYLLHFPHKQRQCCRNAKEMKVFRWLHQNSIPVSGFGRFKMKHTNFDFVSFITKPYFTFLFGSN